MSTPADEPDPKTSADEDSRHDPTKGHTLPDPMPTFTEHPGQGAEINVSQSVPPPRTEIPSVLVDHPRYRVEKVLGYGGMGVVYQAEHRVMNRPVALKVISGHLTNQSDARQRFEVEVKAAARLDHPNIVRAFDAEQEGDAFFLVMELIDGASLDRVLSERGRLSVEEACDYAKQVAQGLQYAHEHGMVHRDVKPHNLMVTAEGQVKILDFGLARLGTLNRSYQGLTPDGSLMGTPDYVAPEQARNSSGVDIRADVYSLGCTLYHFLAGRPPFPEGGVATKIVAHLENEPIALSMLVADLPPQLVEIVERMMAKTPEERFATPGAVVEALEAIATSSNFDRVLHSDLWDVVMPLKHRDIWEGFEGAYFAFNAPFQLESARRLEDHVRRHQKRYEDPALKHANYLFFLGEGREQQVRSLQRLERFREFLRRLLQLTPSAARKIRIRFVPGAIPSETFFTGRKQEKPFSIIYIHENRFFMDGDMPLRVLVSAEEEAHLSLRKRFTAQWERHPELECAPQDVVAGQPKALFRRMTAQTQYGRRISSRAAKLKFSPTLSIHEEVGARARRNEMTYHLGFGQAPFPVHPRLKKALADAAHRNEYLPVAGHEELRAAVLDFYQDRLGFPDDKYRVIVAPGSKALLYGAQLALDGDLLLPVPSWVSYAPQAKLLGTHVIRVPTQLYPGHYFPTGEQLRKSIRRARGEGRQPSKLILNYPNNPTGLTIAPERMQDIAAVCAEENVVIFSDEIYGLVDFRGRHRSIAQCSGEHQTIVLSGLSKHISLGGWRLGIALVPNEIEGLFEALLAIGSEVWSTASAPVQLAALEAYRDPSGEIAAYVETCTRVHGVVMKWMRDELACVGVNYPDPQGAFYLYPEFTLFTEQLAKTGITTSDELAARLLRECGVATLPGTAFADHPKSLRLRLAGCDYRDGPLDKPDGFARIETMLEVGDDADELVRKACPRVHEGMKRLTTFLAQL